MVSGALILKKCEVHQFCIKDFLQHRFSKIIWPTLFWFVVGSVMAAVGLPHDELGILWFMYSMIGLYLLAPILIRWLSVVTRREIEFYLFLWIISLCYPLLNTYFSLRENVASWIYYFHGYVGYYVLGFYLRTYGLSSRLRRVFWCVFIIMSLILPICNFLEEWHWPMIPTFWYRSISVALMSVAWWEVIRSNVNKFEFLRGVVTDLSPLTFGIYLVHIIVMRSVLWQLPWMHSLYGPVQIIVCTFITFLLSIAITWLISKWRFSKYIIGI